MFITLINKNNACKMTLDTFIELKDNAWQHESDLLIVISFIKQTF